MVSKKSSGSKKTWWLAAASLLIAIVAIWWAWNHWHKNNTASSNTTAPTATAPVNSKGDKVPTTPNSANQGTPTDKNGSSTNNLPSSDQWLTSASGVITVKLPTSNTTFKSGDTMTGSAKVDQVQYILIDNQAGVVSQGPVKVVNGTFTAAINFKAYGDSGRLDVFTTEPNGKEINLVQVPLKF